MYTVEPTMYPYLCILCGVKPSTPHPQQNPTPSPPPPPPLHHTHILADNAALGH